MLYSPWVTRSDLFGYLMCIVTLKFLLMRPIIWLEKSILSLTLLRWVVNVPSVGISLTALKASGVASCNCLCGVREVLWTEVLRPLNLLSRG